jgi:CDGSH-type Zn-finger protein
LKSVFGVDGPNGWIDPDGAEAVEIINTVMKCPSGALSYQMGDGPVINSFNQDCSIQIAKNGPYHVRGNHFILDGVDLLEGGSKEHVALCRCGNSKNNPFCDGSHWYDKDFRPDDNLYRVGMRSDIQEDGKGEGEGPNKLKLLLHLDQKTKQIKVTDISAKKVFPSTVDETYGEIFVERKLLEAGTAPTSDIEDLLKPPAGGTAAAASGKTEIRVREEPKINEIKGKYFFFLFLFFFSFLL